MTATDLSDRAHWVYRCYDAEQRLIYVGCTIALFARLQDHDRNAWWADQTAHVKAVVIRGQQAGRSLEKQAIHTEHPRWNVKHRWLTRRTWSRAHYRDFAYATLRYDSCQTPRSPALLRVYREFENRFGEPMRDPRIDNASWESRGRSTFADAERHRAFMLRRSTPRQKDAA